MGAVLAGGRSRRFGGDKLLFRVNGKSLILHTLERLQSASLIDEVVVVASPDNGGKLRALGFEVMVDELTIGPMGGLYTALGSGDAFVVAGDMPLIVPEFVDYIVRIARGKIACVPRWSNGYLEPLHAAYSNAFRSVLEERIKLGNYSLNEAIRSVDACYLRIEELPERWRVSFFNINRRSDLQKIRGNSICNSGAL